MRRSCQQECKLNARRALCLLLCPLYLYCVLCPVSPLCFPLCKCHRVSQRGRGENMWMLFCCKARFSILEGEFSTSNFRLRSHVKTAICCRLRIFGPYNPYMSESRSECLRCCVYFGKHYLGLEKSPITYMFPIWNNLDEIYWESRWNKCWIF